MFSPLFDVCLMVKKVKVTSLQQTTACLLVSSWRKLFLMINFGRKYTVYFNFTTLMLWARSPHEGMQPLTRFKKIPLLWEKTEFIYNIFYPKAKVTTTPSWPRMCGSDFVFDPNYERLLAEAMSPLEINLRTFAEDWAAITHFQNTWLPLHSRLKLYVSVSPTENTVAEILCESATGDQGWRVLAPSSRPPVTYTA